MSKMGNVKVKVDGYKFDSKMEADYYFYLKVQKEKGEIKDFEVHPKFVLQEKFKYHGKTIAAITYTSDFKVYNLDDTISIIDVKGQKTNEFKIKEKMLKFILKDEIPIEVYCVTLYKEHWIPY